MIHFRATGRAAYARTDEPLTTGSVGIPVEVTLSSDFDGLQSVVVFRSGDVTADVALLGQDVVVPPQVLTGRVLTMGVYASSTDGTVAIPTVWCDVGLIRGSAATEFDPAEPTPGWSAQIQAWAEDAADSATQAAGVADSIRADMDEFNETSAVVIAEAQAATTAANEGAANANGAAEAATSAKGAANVATENAIEATSAARTATTTANDAATLATNAAGTANAAATNADIATEAARQATAAASEATTAASAATSAAQASTANANSATAAAQQATSNAITATGNADIATAAASEATTAANDAAGAANAAASAANSAAAGANGAASYATTAATTANGAAATANTAAAGADDATDRANAAIAAMGDISEQAVPLMSADVRGGAKIQPDSGLEITDTDSLQVRLALESDGTVRGGLAEVTAKGHAEQDGTPTPESPVPIQVVRGRNLLDFDTNTFNGYTSSNGQVFTDSTNKSVIVNVEPNTAYTFSGKHAVADDFAINEFSAYPATGDSGFRRTATITTLVARETFTTQPTTHFLMIKIANTRAVDFDATKATCQLELGSTPTPYVPYGHVGMEVRDPDTDELISCTALPLPQRGWVAGLPDGTADVLTLDGAGKCEWTLPTSEVTFDGSNDENWGLASGEPNNAYTIVQDMIAVKYDHVTPFSIMCDRFAFKGSYDPNRYIVSSVTIGPNSNKSAISINWHGIAESMTREEWKTWLSTHPVTVLYPLATPVIEDCGYVEDWPTDIPEGATVTIPELDAVGVKYFIDSAVTELAKQWHDRIAYERTIATQEALASVAPTEHSPAESNHSVGELITYEGALYRVTAAIARGESITIGTNVAATTVAEQLAALQ